MQRALLVLMALAFLAVAGCERDSDAAAARPVPAAAVVRPEPAPTPSPPPAQPTQAEPSCGGETGGECGGGCDQWNEAAAEVIAREVPADAVWTTLEVTGMRCSNCEQRIIANVGKLDGVLAVEADAELAQVRIAMAKDAKDVKVHATDRINQLGYHAK